MPEIRLGLSIGQHSLRKGQLSLKRKTTVANQAKDRLGLKTKSQQWCINDARLGFNQRQRRFKKEHLGLNEGNREHSVPAKLCERVSFNTEVAACLQLNGNGGSTRNTLLAVEDPVCFPINIESGH